MSADDDGEFDHYAGLRPHKPRWVTEWQCDECRRRVVRGQCATRNGRVACGPCLRRGIVSHLTAIVWEPL
jgi:formylmethanofuran dehydrogenase subunit E